MKDFELHLKEDETELITQHLKRKKFQSLKPQAGHSCFELDLISGEISLVDYAEINKDFITANNGDNAVHKKVITKETCLYTTALNKKNAEKKFVKILLGYASNPTG
jgi:hypothetical protein